MNKIVDFVQYFLRARIGPIDLVDHHDRLELGFERLGQHVPRLRQRPLGRIHQQHHAVHHLQRALHLAAKIGVARRVDNVDLAAFKIDGRVLGENGDAALPLQFVRVHHALGHLLVGAKCAGLAQHGVNKGGLTVVNVGDDGDIAYRLAHSGYIPFLLGQTWDLRLGRPQKGLQVRYENAMNGHTLRHLPFYQQARFFTRGVESRGSQMKRGEGIRGSASPPAYCIVATCRPLRSRQTC